MKRPVVLATYSNSDAQYLMHLNQEMKDIWSCFLSSQIDGDVEYAAPPFDVTTDDFEVIIKQVRYLTIFHYSGHADPANLLIEEKEFAASQLMKLLKGITVDVVMLNGCSTEGFVDEMLKKGVKAVIASNRSVNDLTASQFANLFYASLLKGNTLLDAFDNAVFKLDEKKVPVQRGMLKISNTNQQCPWGIYYDKDDPDKFAQVNQFRLIDPSEHQISPLTNSEIEKEIKALQETATQLEEAITEFKERGSSLLLKMLTKGMEPPFDPANPAAPVLDIYRKIASLLSRQYEPLIETALLTKFSVFDYQEQRDTYSQIAEKQFTEATTSSKKPLMGAFLLQGSPRCGLGLLQRNIQDTYDLPISSQLIELIRIPLNANAKKPLRTDLLSIWQAVGEQIGKGQEDPDTIAAEISRRHRQKPVVLVFAGGELPKTNLAILKEFWIDFKDRFYRTKSQSTYKVLLFVQAIFKEGIPTVSPYDQAIAISDDACIIPVVKRVNQGVVDRWKTSVGIPYQYDMSYFQNGPPVMDAIKEICDKLKDRDPKYWHLYENYLAQYTIISKS